jgi:cellulose biosynthesis protein BcsQ
VKPELYLNDFLWNKRRLADCVMRPMKNLDLLCSNRDTLEAEQRATGTIGRERIFEDILQPIEDAYDAILLDIGPSLSLMQICAMVSTTDYLVPISMDALSVTGATRVFQYRAATGVQIKKACRCIGVPPTVVDHRYQNTDMVMKMIRVICENYKVPSFPGIRTDAVVAKAIRQRHFMDVDSKAKCLADYRVVSEQILALYGIPPEGLNVGTQEATQVA